MSYKASAPWTANDWAYAGLLDENRRIKEDTIERCAQVAEQMAECNYLSIAAAIRGLKGAPPVDPNIIHPGKDPDFVFPEEQ